ncbi:MAG: heavy-metal-associated domain-containing protein [Pseudomonadota bacterium]
MTVFEVKDMTCGHCESAITKAVHAVDPSAKVQIDLPAHRVEISSTSADAAALGRAIAGAGYTPTSTTLNPISTKSAGKQTGGCGCGCR